MGLVLRRRGQISLEFMLVFSIMLIMLLYSVKNVGFDSSSPSSSTLAIQIALEEKSVANAISNTISQVYAQGPGSKATTYVTLTYLRNPSYLKKGLGIADPQIFITYGPFNGLGNGTYMGIISERTAAVYTHGTDKNVVWSSGMYQKVLYSNSSVWSPKKAVTMESLTVYGLVISPTHLNSTLKIVVEWNPDKGDSWNYNATVGELRININPGG